MESSGTAPESEPFITSAFILIVPRDTLEIEALPRLFKRLENDGDRVVLWKWFALLSCKLKL